MNILDEILSVPERGTAHELGCPCKECHTKNNNAYPPRGKHIINRAYPPTETVLDEIIQQNLYNDVIAREDPPNINTPGRITDSESAPWKFENGELNLYGFKKNDYKLLDAHKKGLTVMRDRILRTWFFAVKGSWRDIKPITTIIIQGSEDRDEIANDLGKSRADEALKEFNSIKDILKRNKIIAFVPKSVGNKYPNVPGKVHPTNKYVTFYLLLLEPEPLLNWVCKIYKDILIDPVKYGVDQIFENPLKPGYKLLGINRLRASYKNNTKCLVEKLQTSSVNDFYYAITDFTRRYFPSSGTTPPKIIKSARRELLISFYYYIRDRDPDSLKDTKLIGKLVYALMHKIYSEMDALLNQVVSYLKVNQTDYGSSVSNHVKSMVSDIRKHKHDPTSIYSCLDYTL